MKILRRNHENPAAGLNLDFPSNRGLREFERGKRFGIFLLGVRVLTWEMVLIGRKNSLEPNPKVTKTSLYLLGLLDMLNFNLKRRN